MSDEVQYKSSWPDKKTQCKNCQNYQEKDNKHGCVPKDITFEQAIEAYGEVSPTGHCNQFKAK